MKKRIDILLAEGGLCRSRSEAKDLVDRGLVEVEGIVIDKASREFEDEKFLGLVKNKKVRILVEQYVGRGAYKLLQALKVFDINVKNKVCLDIGSSTGGFTQALLQNDAKKVFAVDVGSEQFDKNLLEKYKFTSPPTPLQKRGENRIVLRENIDIRNFEIEEKVDLVACDVSFISVKEIIKILPKFLKSGGEVILLVKPQFEVGKRELGRGGIVKDRELQNRVLEDIKTFAKGNGFEVMGETESPIEGGGGNVEFLLYMC